MFMYLYIGKMMLRLVNITQPTRELGSILRSSKAGADDLKLVQNLTDLLERGLQIDPSKRLTVVEALKHPFFVNNKE
jgi:serine/threonine protein kinase